MDETTDTRDCKETKVSVEMDSDALDAETTRLDSLIFPWPLVRLVIDSKDIYASKAKLFKHLLLSHHLQLVVVLIISVVCLAFGIACFEQAYDRRVLCVVFIVQGVSGLFAVSAYTSVTTSLGPTFLMKQFTLDRRQATRYLITVTHLMVVLCLIWFFIGHIWFVEELLGYSDLYGTRLTLYIFTIAMVIIQYILGICLLSSCIHRNRRLMQRIQEKTQRGSDQVGQCHTPVEIQQTAKVEKIESKKDLIDEDLILLDYNHGGCLTQNVLQQV